MCEPNNFYFEIFLTFWFDTEKALFQVILGLLLVYADWEKGGACLRVCMCMWFMTYNYWDMFFIVRSNDSFNFPLGLIKYIVIVCGEPCQCVHLCAGLCRAVLCVCAGLCQVCVCQCCVCFVVVGLCVCGVVCACVVCEVLCVHVRVCERERERERGHYSTLPAGINYICDKCLSLSYYSSMVYKLYWWANVWV